MLLATPTILLGFLLPWAWGISHGCSSKAQLLLLTLDEGYLLTAALPNLQRGMVSGLTFRSLIHFEFAVVFGIREWFNFIIL